MANKESLDHKCIICGTMYHACDTCQQVKTYTPWRTLCDTFDHYRIYLVIREWQEKIISKSEAQQKLRELGVTKNVRKDWPAGTVKLLAEIFEGTKKQKVVPVEITEEVIEPEIMPEIEADIE